MLTMFLTDARWFKRLLVVVSAAPAILSSSLDRDMRMMSATNVSATLAASCPILPALENRTTITGSLEIFLLGNAAQPVGHMEEVTTSLNVQYELFTSDKKLIAKRANPYFWQSYATIYDCHDKKISELQYTWSPSGAMGSPDKMSILDGSGKHVGNWKAPGPANPSVGMIQDLAGNSVVHFNVAIKRVLGILPVPDSVSIQLFPALASLSPGLTEARLLSLLAASVLSPSPVGPLWRWLIIVVLLLICLDCAWICCRRCCCRREASQNVYAEIEAAERRKMEASREYATYTDRTLQSNHTASSATDIAATARSRELLRQGPGEQPQPKPWTLQWLFCCARGDAKAQTVEMVPDATMLPR